MRITPMSLPDSKKPRLGEVLQQQGAVSGKVLEIAIQEMDRSVYLGEHLLRKGLVSKESLAAALQTVIGVPYVDCEAMEAERQALDCVSRELALKYCCLPAHLQGRELVIVFSEPQNLRKINDLQFVTGFRVSPRLGFQAEIRTAIDRYLPQHGMSNAPSPPVVKPVVQPMPSRPANPNRPALQEAGALDIEFITTSSRQRAKEAVREFQAALRGKPTPAVRLVSEMISIAASKRASDIHIDPQATETVVRLRVDGILRDLMPVPQQLSTQLVSRIKILSDMDIAERRTPQDGRFLVRIDDKKLDVRVSTLPMHYGEKVVMRLLAPDSARSRFTDLGFSEEDSQALAETVSLPQGLVLACGPTGSGKSTTLYSALHQLSARSVNIITVEDPVEYMIEGVNQVQVNRKAGLTFAGCLRSILRQDPNIVMVGEIRDKETAEIALTAAQTGHLVLSTLHTADSIAALDRLRDLGIPGYLIASSVTAVISQRLVRKLCGCRTEREELTSSSELPPYAGVTHSEAGIGEPTGCPRCDNTGYSGRVGVFEVLIINDEIRRLIHNGVGTSEIRALVAGAGMRFLRDDAIEKVRQGLTSMEELLRVIPMSERASLRCPDCEKELLAAFGFCPYCGTKVPRLGPVSAPSPHRSGAAQQTMQSGS